MRVVIRIMPIIRRVRNVLESTRSPGMRFLLGRGGKGVPERNTPKSTRSPGMRLFCPSRYPLRVSCHFVPLRVNARNFMLRAPKREYEVSEEGRTEAPSVPHPSITGQGPSRYSSDDGEIYTFAEQQSATGLPPVALCVDVTTIRIEVVTSFSPWRRSPPGPAPGPRSAPAHARPASSSLRPDPAGLPPMPRTAPRSRSAARARPPRRSRD